MFGKQNFNKCSVAQESVNEFGMCISSYTRHMLFLNVLSLCPARTVSCRCTIAVCFIHSNTIGQQPS